MTCFIRSKPEKVLPLQFRRGIYPCVGDVGLEIECEGNIFNKSEDIIAKYWSFTQDHSLRGEDNAEYVLAKPIAFSKVEEAVSLLWADFADNDTTLDESNRTSVHVHLNFQKKYITDVATFACLWFIFEDILATYAGEHRVGNLFCLRAKDAPAIIYTIRDKLQAGLKRSTNDNYKYSGFNIRPLDTLGSIEIRFMRGCIKAQEVIDWVRIVQCLYEAIDDYKDPRDIISFYSYAGPNVFFNKFLGSVEHLIRKGVPSLDEMISRLYEGVYFAQEIAFCRDWNKVIRVEGRVDPFNRHTFDEDSEDGVKELPTIYPISYPATEEEDEDENTALPV